ncbi:hypothetical protein ACFL52_05420 [Candidatus Margulisiibacteriota bacterium]
MLFDLFDSLVFVYIKVYPYLLNLFFAALILTLGILFARLAKYGVVLFFQSLPLDETLKKIRFTSILDKADIKRPFSELIGDFSYWLVIFLIVVTVANYLGLAISPLIDRMLNYMGIVFLAALVLSLGVFLSSLIAGIIHVLGANVGLPGAKTIARLMQYATIIFAFLVALEQLGIGPTLIVPSIGVIIGAVGLALAIAFGLGCKDIMADFISNLIKGK